MQVKNMRGYRGNKVVNQFIIKNTEQHGYNGDKFDTNVTYFQSYDSIIVKVIECFDKVYLDENTWDYSKTTGKYRNLFLGETKKETQAKIDSGEYLLTNLN